MTRFFFVSICLIVGMGHLCQAEVEGPKKIAVLVSRDIRPYLQAVDGFKKGLGKKITATIDTYSLEREQGVTQEVLRKKIEAAGYDLVLAVGPEAMQFIWTDRFSDRTKKVYAMVLNPPGLLPDLCGVPLDIPVGLELKIIKHAFPSFQNLGILYDPSHNDLFVRNAMDQSADVGLKIIPLNVSSKREIPSVLGPQWARLDGLWLIPDPTVISESLVRFLIKKALSGGVAVIGYNRFFYRSGAALSFILDYEQIGEQAAGLSFQILSGKECESVTPAFRTWLNLRVINSLGLNVSVDAALAIEEGP